MAPLFKRILCPIDFDENSMAALDCAAQLAQQHNAMLYILHVVRAPSAPSEVPVEPPVAEWETDARVRVYEAARQHLNGCADFTMVLKTGDPFAAIMEAERELKPDSVVMATHGRTGAGHLLIGSVAEHVVRESSCPVLTVRPHAPQV